MSSTWRSCFPDQTSLDMYFSGIKLRWKAHRDHRTAGDNHAKKGEIRGDQVGAWLSRNSGSSDFHDYFLIDDDLDYHEDQKDRLIHTCSLNGILVEHHERFLEIIDRICLKERG